jgi:4-hydroxybenzoate polyprenyltransferase
LDARGLLLVGVTVMVGQLSIGWSNDWLDAARDLAADRSSKPSVSGAVSVEHLRSAALMALVLSVPLSLAAGWNAGVWHLVLVASGWAYNLGLKAMRWSPLPYLIGFGSLPIYVSVAAGVTPQWWWSASAGLLGVAAHFANAAPDIEADLQHGVRGAPQRLGAHFSLIVCFSLLALVAAVLLLQLSAGLWLAVVGVIALVPVVVGASLAVRGGATRAVFIAVMCAAVVDVALLVTLA